MITIVYPPAHLGDPNLMQDPTYMSERCCLTPLNESSYKINDLILWQLQTPVHTYFSTDRVVIDNLEEAAAYAIKFLNAQTSSGQPKHNLDLKVEPYLILLYTTFFYVFCIIYSKIYSLKAGFHIAVTAIILPVPPSFHPQLPCLQHRRQ